MLSDKELARQSYQGNEKLWARLVLRMDGAMHEAVRELAAVDHRRLEDQMRHLVAVGIRCEFERLKREEEARPAIAAEIDRRHREAVREALANIRKRDAA